MSGSVPKIAQPRFLYPGNSFNPPRPLWLAMKRGWQGLSPCCGHAHRLGDDHCEDCGQSLAPAEFDGAITLFAIPLAFAIAVIAMLGAEELWLMACEQDLPIEVMGLIGLSVATIATLALHRRIAGALLGLQWALWMHGFDPDSPEAKATPVIEAGYEEVNFGMSIELKPLYRAHLTAATDSPRAVSERLS